MKLLAIILVVVAALGAGCGDYWDVDVCGREEKDFVMTMQNTWENAREEGRNEGARSLLLRLLSARFGDLPEAVVSRIGAAGAKEIGRWGERVLRSHTLSEVLDESS